MNAKQFAKFLRRDGGCVHCGAIDTAVPQHRINRGMGGSKLLGQPSNILALCSEMNGLIESDATKAQLARHYGWKLERWENPELVAVWYLLEGAWFFLDEFYGRSLRRDAS